MKENRNKGFFLLAFIGLVSLGASLSFWLTSTPNKDSLIKNKEFLDTAGMKTGTLVVQVTAIGSEPFATLTTEGNRETGNSLYLIEYLDEDNKYGYIGLEMDDDDQELATLLSDTDSLQEHPYYLLVETVSSSDEGAIQNYTSLVSGVFSGTDFDGYVDSSRYVSAEEVKNERTSTLFAVIVFVVLGGLLIILAIFRRMNNVKGYNALYTYYPELQGSVENIPNEAGFYDPVLKIAVYKHHLITFSNGFGVYLLDDAANLYHKVINIKRYGFTIGRTSQLVLVHRDTKKKVGLVFKNKGKTTDELLEPFFAYISEQFPDIQLGYGVESN